MNYARIEAAYSGVDLLELSARRLLNLVFGWLFDLCDSETWDRDFAANFDDFRTEFHEYKEDRDERIKTQVVGDADISIEFTKPSDDDIEALKRMMGVNQGGSIT